MAARCLRAVPALSRAAGLSRCTPPAACTALGPPGQRRHCECGDLGAGGGCPLGRGGRGVEGCGEGARRGSERFEEDRRGSARFGPNAVCRRPRPRHFSPRAVATRIEDGTGGDGGAAPSPGRVCVPTATEGLHRATSRSRVGFCPSRCTLVLSGVCTRSRSSPGPAWGRAAQGAPSTSVP